MKKYDDLINSLEEMLASAKQLNEAGSYVIAKPDERRKISRQIKSCMSNLEALQDMVAKSPDNATG